MLIFLVNETMFEGLCVQETLCQLSLFSQRNLWFHETWAQNWTDQKDATLLLERIQLKDMFLALQCAGSSQLCQYSNVRHNSVSESSVLHNSVSDSIVCNSSVSVTLMIITILSVTPMSVHNSISDSNDCQNSVSDSILLWEFVDQLISWAFLLAHISLWGIATDTLLPFISVLGESSQFSPGFTHFHDTRHFCLVLYQLDPGHLFGFTCLRLFHWFCLKWPGQQPVKKNFLWWLHTTCKKGRCGMCFLPWP